MKENPVYLVVWEQIRDTDMLVKRILKVIECDLSNINEVYRREVSPLQYMRNIGTDIFAREPANPFRAIREEEEKEKVRA